MRKRKKKNKQKKIIITLSITFLFIMTTSYAAFTTNINIKGNTNINTNGIFPSQLKALAITEGDGLYLDSTEEERYIYKGGEPNNYITFNDETWRIISVEKNNTLKIIKNETIGDMAFDTNGLRTTGYCSYGDVLTFGCNAWMKMDYYEPFYEKYAGEVESDAELNAYLNTEYYSTLSKEAKEKIEIGTFYIGAMGSSFFSQYNTQTIKENYKREKEYAWNGKIALATLTEYIKASNNSSCKTTINSYYKDSACYENSENHNWMYKIVKTTEKKIYVAINSLGVYRKLCKHVCIFSFSFRR